MKYVGQRLVKAVKAVLRSQDIKRAVPLLQQVLSSCARNRKPLASFCHTLMSALAKVLESRASPICQRGVFLCLGICTPTRVCCYTVERLDSAAVTRSNQLVNDIPLQIAPGRKVAQQRRKNVENTCVGEVE